MCTKPIRVTFACLISLLLVSVAVSEPPTKEKGQSRVTSKTLKNKQMKGKAVTIEYLEIVTPNIEETCEALAQAHGVKFSAPVPELGNARTANLKDGGRIGVRAPMRDTEKPIVRPYVLVDDIETAVKAAEKAGGQVAMPPMKLPGQGTLAIYILGGIEHGLWQR